MQIRKYSAESLYVIIVTPNDIHLSSIPPIVDTYGGLFSLERLHVLDIFCAIEIANVFGRLILTFTGRTRYALLAVRTGTHAKAHTDRITGWNEDQSRN